MRISDWSSDVCSSDLEAAPSVTQLGAAPLVTSGVTYYDFATGQTVQIATTTGGNPFLRAEQRRDLKLGLNWEVPRVDGLRSSIDYNHNRSDRSEEHTSELQSLMRIAYAVFCLKKKKT